MANFLLLCWEFFKTGLFSIGGGLATIPFLQEMSLKYGWFSLTDLTTMVAISESTPGPMGVNMATYVGNHLYGFFGGIATILSVTAPAFLSIILIATALQKFEDSVIVQNAFMGLRPAVVGLITSAVIGIYLLALFDITAFKTTKSLFSLFKWKPIIIFACMLAVYHFKPKTHPILFILVAAVIGILLKL